MAPRVRRMLCRKWLEGERVYRPENPETLSLFKRPGCKSFLCHPRGEKKVVCRCCDGVKEGDVPQSTP